MKFTITLVISLSFGIATAQEVAPRHEIGLTLGGLLGAQHTGGSTRLDLGSGVALQANYGYRLLGGETAALYGEVHFLAKPFNVAELARAVRRVLDARGTEALHEEQQPS